MPSIVTRDGKSKEIYHCVCVCVCVCVCEFFDPVEIQIKSGQPEVHVKINIFLSM